MLRNRLPLLLVLAVTSCAAETSVWEAGRQLPLNLEPLFDNDAIAGQDDRGDGNFDCPDHAIDIPGSTFPAEYLPATGTVFSFDGIHFLFPSKEKGDLNNLACAGQELRVPPGRYKALHIVGTSENGNFRGTMHLAYREGPAEAELALTDWCQQPKFGERAAFEADHRYTYSQRGVVRDEVRPRLWLQQIALDPEKHLEAITLPYSQRMHLFAATLEAVDWSEEHAAAAQATAERYASLGTRRALPGDDLRRRFDDLAAQLDDADGGPYPRQTDWLRTRAAYWRHQLSDGPGLRATRQAARALRQLDRDRLALEAGKDPFPDRRGNFLRSYRSELDGSLQSYSLAVPRDYDGTKPFPMIVTLHGHGWYKPYQGHPQRTVEGVFMVAPHGRGSIDYMLAAEGDVLAVVDDVLSDYHIDRDRIYLEGHSMGGTGSWHLGVHYPDRFAAIAPVCGNCDRRAWDAWKPERRPPPHPIPPRFEKLRTFLLDAVDPITYAGNLLNVPAFVIHGSADDVVPVGHSQNMSRALKALGCDVTYIEVPFGRHWGFGQIFYEQRWNWMVSHQRPERPERVRLKAASLRHGSAYWVRMERMTSRLAFAEVDARRLADGSIEVATANVAALTLDLEGTPKVTIDGQRAEGAGPTFVLDGQWRSAPLPKGLAKRRGLEGPVGHVFLDSFLLVRGTASADPWEREVIAREVEARARDWERLYNCRPRVKDDTAITDDDIARHGLVLYGGPAANAVTARIAGRLPVRIEADRIAVGARSWQGPDVGVKLCCPNPLNPKRLVAVFAGLSPAAMDQINNRFGNWFGWGPYDNYEWFDYGVFDARTLSPETFLCVGFLDSQWKLNPECQFLGNEAIRGDRLPQRVPTLASLPADPPATLYLDDLAPSLVDQHKGVVGFRRSFEGNPLTLGGRTFDRGLGVRAPSVVEYQLGGRYATLRATVGIDLEDQIKVSEARARGEYVQFLVYGDGKRLYASEWLRWDSVPAKLEVDVRGVNVLRLQVDCSAKRWLVGSADWADVRITRE
jgi:acetyl esterase/lipase